MSVSLVSSHLKVTETLTQTNKMLSFRAFFNKIKSKSFSDKCLQYLNLTLSEFFFKCLCDHLIQKILSLKVDILLIRFHLSLTL